MNGFKKLAENCALTIHYSICTILDNFPISETTINFPYL